MESLVRYVEDRLKLKVNREKSAVARPWKRKFLGFSTQKVFGRIRTSVPEITLARFRKRLKELFREGRGRNPGRFIAERLNPVLRGWLQYFRLGTSRRQLATLDFWIRRRLRCMIWRQWKRPATRMRKLRALGLHDDRAYTGFSRKGPWACAGTPAACQALTPDYFDALGLHGLTASFDAMRTTST